MHETWVVWRRIHRCAVDLARGHVLVLRLHGALSLEMLYGRQAHGSCAAWRATKVGCLLLLLRWRRWWCVVSVGRGVIVLLLVVLLLRARLVVVRREIGLHSCRRGGRHRLRRRRRLLVRYGRSTVRALRRTLVALILLHGCSRVPRRRHLRGSSFHALAHTRFLLRSRTNLARLLRPAAPSSERADLPKRGTVSVGYERCGQGSMEYGLPLYVRKS